MSSNSVEIVKLRKDIRITRFWREERVGLGEERAREVRERRKMREKGAGSSFNGHGGEGRLVKP